MKRVTRPSFIVINEEENENGHHFAAWVWGNHYRLGIQGTTSNHNENAVTAEVYDATHGYLISWLVYHSDFDDPEPYVLHRLVEDFLNKREIEWVTAPTHSHRNLHPFKSRYVKGDAVHFEGWCHLVLEMTTVCFETAWRRGVTVIRNNQKLWVDILDITPCTCQKENQHNE